MTAFHGGNGNWIEGVIKDVDAASAKVTEALKVHGEGLCHICGKPKASKGLDICSYPHGMVPDDPVDPAHPEGMWTWKRL